MYLDVGMSARSHTLFLRYERDSDLRYLSTQLYRDGHNFLSNREAASDTTAWQDV
jgi:hypothetical protein